ncbi:MAG: hypothetical protein ABIJ08_06905 [Nanoarchaeota archaeon]
MNKKGVGMTFPVIVTAIIALVILLVMLAIYTGFFKNITGDIKKPADEAGKGASEAAWCMQAYLKGDECIVETLPAGCKPSVKTGDEESCLGTEPNHRILKSSNEHNCCP